MGAFARKGVDRLDGVVRDEGRERVEVVQITCAVGLRRADGQMEMVSTKQETRSSHFAGRKG